MDTKVMRRKRARRRKVISGISIFLILIVLVSLFSVSVSADRGTDYSFYNVSSAAGGYFSKYISPERNDESDSGLIVRFGSSSDGQSGSTGGGTGNAGIYLAYCDEQNTDGLIYGWIMSALSSSSVTYSYKSLQDASDEGSVKAVHAYAQFGNMLNQLGLDSTGGEGIDLLRIIAGALLWLFYVLAASVNFVFMLVAKLLKMLNPFRLFAGVGEVGKALGVKNKGEDSIFAGVYKTVSGWYNTISDFSWEIIIPIFFIVILVTIFIMKLTRNQMMQTDKQRSILSKIKAYTIRIMFLVIGIPLLAGTYTLALDKMDNMAAADAMGPTKVVGSTLIDFESWTKNTNLAIPSSGTKNVNFSVDYDSSTGEATPKPALLASARSLCFYANSVSGALGDDFKYGTVKSSGDIDSDTESAVNNNALTYDRENHKGTETEVTDSHGNTKTKVTYKSNDVSSSGASDTAALCMDMITRYMLNNHIYASDVEAWSKISSKSDNDRWKKWFEEIKNVDRWDEAKWLGHGDDAEPAQKLLFDGNITSSTSGGTIKYGMADANGKGLSTVSMYNYLSTKFTETSATVYSNEKASSGFVREQHHSVNVVGTGLIGFLYYMNALALLIAYAVLGWFYAFSIFLANIQRGIRLISSIPFALLGGLKAIAQVVTYTVLLIIEILATLFLYSIVSSLLLSLSDIAVNLFSMINMGVGDFSLAIGPNMNVAGSSALGVILFPVFLILQFVLVIAFTMKAIQIRKPVIKVIDEMIEGPITRWFTTGHSTMPGAGGKPNGAKAHAGGEKGGKGPAPQKALSAGQGEKGKQGAFGAGKDAESEDSSTSLDNLGGTSDSAGGLGSNDVSSTNVAGDSNSTALSVAGGSGDSSSMMSTGASADGGSDGTGMVASKVTSARYGDGDKEIEEENEGKDALSRPRLGVPGSSEPSKEEKQQNRDVKAQEFEEKLKDAMGVSGRSVSDQMQFDEDKRKEKKALKKAAMDKAKEGAEQTVVGAGEVIAGVYTGDAGLVKDGVKNADHGTQKVGSAKKDLKNADANATASALERQRARDATNGSGSNGGVVNNYGGTSSSKSNYAFSDNSKTSKVSRPTKPEKKNMGPQGNRPSGGRTAARSTGIEAQSKSQRQQNQQTRRNAQEAKRRVSNDRQTSSNNSKRRLEKINTSADE